MGQFITSELHTDMFGTLLQRKASQSDRALDVRTTPHTGRAGCARPLVSLKVPANVITWVYLRNAAIDIGRQFQVRVS